MRTCTVCSHPDREDIDQALLEGGPYRGIAQRYEASASAVYRHKQDHLPKALVRAVEAQVVEHGADLLDQLQDLQQRAHRILDQAEAAGDLRTALAAIREARGCVELLGKATGELADYYRKASGERRNVSNIHRVMSLNPKSMVAIDAFQRSWREEGVLSPRHREMVALVTSALNKCHY